MLNIMTESHTHAEQEKPDTKGVYIFYNSIYMVSQNKKKQSMETEVRIVMTSAGV